MTRSPRDARQLVGGPTTQRITLRVPVDLVEEIDALAEECYGGVRSEAARAALWSYVDDLREDPALDGSGFDGP